MSASQGPKAALNSSAGTLRRGGQRSFIGPHDTAFFFARTHLVGRDAVLIIRDRALILEARVLLPRVCRACGEQAFARHNRGCHRNTKSHFRNLQITQIVAIRHLFVLSRVKRQASISMLCISRRPNLSSVALTTPPKRRSMSCQS